MKEEEADKKDCVRLVIADELISVKLCRIGDVRISTVEGTCTGRLVLVTKTS